SPVTRGRDREQFRIQAAWEARPTQPTPAPPRTAQTPAAPVDARRPSPPTGAAPGLAPPVPGMPVPPPMPPPTERAPDSLAAPAPAVAASELQNLVKGMASAAKTETRSERILPTVERGELVEIPVEIAVSGEVRELVDLLNRIDASPKLIRVTDLKIRVMNITQPK